MRVEYFHSHNLEWFKFNYNERPCISFRCKIKRKYAEANPTLRLIPNISELKCLEHRNLIKIPVLDILVVIWFKNCKTVVSFD